jgi:protein MpaA
MGRKQTHAQKLVSFVRSHKIVCVALLAACQVGLVAYAVTQFVLPHTVQFSYAATVACTTSPQVLPGLFKTETNQAFRVIRPATLSVFGAALFSPTVCVTPSGKQIPLATATHKNSERIIVAGKTVFTRTVTTHTPAYAQVTASTSAPIATNQSIQFTLSQPDKTFRYVLVANKQQTTCAAAHARLSCSAKPLGLAYASSYTATLERQFQAKLVNLPAQQKLQTITATTIVTSSIVPDAVVYDKPQQITLQTDKTLTALTPPVLKHKGTETVIPTTSTFADKTITVTIPAPLPRSSSLSLHVADLTATDASTLATPYTLDFTMSGGPKVTGVNIASYGLTAGQPIVVSFNQTLAGAQNPDIVTLLVNGAAVPATVQYGQRSVTVTPKTGYPVCGTVVVRFSAGVQNPAGISGDSAWSFTSRARCYTTSSIGTSVQGRPITAYRFGSGASMVLYVGATHGNESNTARLLQKWIATLDASPGGIPAGRTIVVIPQANPDGVVASSRLNSRGIDLNRNFPANDWQTSVTLPGSPAVTAAGGPSALSEPESAALAGFVQANRPRFVLTYHSRAAIVEANEAGDSVAVAAAYAKSAGYAAIPASNSGGVFDYSTTGAFETWMKDKLGLPAAVVELETSTYDEYGSNQSAMWAAAKLGA